MQLRVCPWWFGYWLICRVRHYWQSSHKLLSAYVHEGMTVLEPGLGMDKLHAGTCAPGAVFGEGGCGWRSVEDGRPSRPPC